MNGTHGVDTSATSPRRASPRATSSSLRATRARPCTSSSRERSTVSYDEHRSVRLGVGKSFGEMSLIDKRPRSATVTAVYRRDVGSDQPGLRSSCSCTTRHTSRSRSCDRSPIVLRQARQPDAGHRRLSERPLVPRAPGLPMEHDGPRDGPLRGAPMTRRRAIKSVPSSGLSSVSSSGFECSSRSTPTLGFSCSSRASWGRDRRCSHRRACQSTVTAWPVRSSRRRPSPRRSSPGR